MSFVISFFAAHPELLVPVVAAVESAIMPFIPVKYNGLAMTLVNLLTKKKEEPK